MPAHLRRRLVLNSIWPAFILAGIDCLFSAFSNSDYLISENVDAHSIMMIISGILLADFHRKTSFAAQHLQAAFGVFCIAGAAFLIALPNDFLHPAAHLAFGLGTAGIGLTLSRFGRSIAKDSPFPGCITPSFILLGIAITASYTTYYGEPVSYLTMLQTSFPLLSVDMLYTAIQLMTALCLQRWLNRVSDRPDAVETAEAGSRLLIAVPLLAVTGILLASHLEVRALADLEATTSNQAKNILERVKDQLREDERLTLFASRHPAIISALSGGPLEECDDAIRQSGEAMPGFAWFVTNARGISISLTPQSPPVASIGHDISDRPYIAEALAGRTGSHFAMGVTSREPGHYTSRPVFHADGAIIGAVVLKRPVNTLQKLFELHEHAFLVSPEGIVFLGSRRAWQLKPLFPLSPEQRTLLERSRRYGATATDSVFAAPLPTQGYTRAFDREMFSSQAVLSEDGWRIILMNDMSQVALSRHLPLALAVSLVILALAFHIGTARVTEKARQAVEFEQQFKSVFENAPEGILIIDAATHLVLAANPFMFRALGIGDPELLKRLRYEDICPEGVGDSFEFFRRVSGTETAAVERRLEYAAGHAFHGEITGSALRLGDRDAFLLFIRDLTSRRLLEKMRNESEERFKKLFAAAPNGFILIREEDHTIVEVNAAALDMIGQKYEDVIGRVCHRFICPTEAGKCPISDLQQSIDRSERVLLGPGGSRIPIIKQVIRLELGGVPHLLENFIDIRQRKGMEHALARAKEAAEAADLEKSRFIAHMSHEIRTPMNALLGLIDVLHAELTVPRQRHYLTLIKSAGESLLALLNDILDFSKIGAGRMELEESRFDLPALVRATLDLLSGKAAAKRIELKGEIDPQLPGLVVGDQFRLRQILLNLLNNALKFTDQGEVTLAVTRIPTAEPGVITVSVEVRDTGIGIPSDQISHLFESFSQIRSGGPRRQEGTGLGLTICRQLVQLMKGEISVQSEPGRGSTFRFTVRLRLPEAIPTGTETESPPERAAGTGHVGTILVADDNEINRELACTLLKTGGWKVTSVGTGREILDLTAVSEFDLVLADIQMPEMSGTEAVRAVRERERTTGRHLPMIALTGNALPEDRQSFLDAGFDGCLVKPFTRQDLFDIMGDTLARLRELMGAPPTIDIEHLMKRVCGDAGVLLKMIDIFLAKYPVQIAALETACRNADLAAVSMKAHSLKGAIGTYASERVFQAIGDVESAARSGSAADVTAAMERFTPLLGGFVKELEALRVKLRKDAGSEPEHRPTA